VGALTGNTIITGAYNFGINTANINLTGGTAINLTGTVTLQSTPLSGTTTDAILVWNSVDKKIKQISQNVVNVCNVIS
jgi:energy-converting hydrogenase Eha subunit H